MKRRRFALIVLAAFAPSGALFQAHSAPGKSAGRRAVRSTSIASVGYVRARQALAIEFRSGAVYRYLGVPEAVHGALLSAESKGRYFTEHIRGQYEFMRIKVDAP